MKMGEDAKRLLDALQAKLVLSEGRKMSQQELLDSIVRFSSEREEELIRLLAGVKLPIPLQEVERLIKIPRDWGVDTREEEIDQILYGRGKRKR